VVDQHRLLALAQTLWPAAGRAVDQTGEALGVEALDGIAQRLSLDASGPRRFRPAHAIKRVGDRQQAQSCPPTRLPLGVLPELSGCGHVTPDLDGARHRLLPGPGRQ